MSGVWPDDLEARMNKYAELVKRLRDEARADYDFGIQEVPNSSHILPLKQRTEWLAADAIEALTASHLAPSVTAERLRFNDLWVAEFGETTSQEQADRCALAYWGWRMRADQPLGNAVAASLAAVIPMLETIQAFAPPGDHDETIARAKHNLAAFIAQTKTPGD